MEKTKDHYVIVALLMASVTLSGTTNSFSGRIRAEAFGDSDFVVVVYDSIIYFMFNLIAVCTIAAYHGITRAQLRFLFRTEGRDWSRWGPAKFLVLAGMSDVADSVTGFAAQPHLTPLMMSLMNQATTPFTVLASMLLLGTRYSWLELICVLTVLGAAVLSVFVESSNGTDTNFFWAIFAAATTAFAAVSFVLKEKTFNMYDAHKAAMVSIEPEMAVALAVDDQNCERLDPKVADFPPQLSVFLVGIVVATVGLITCIPIALLNQAILDSSNPVLPAFEKGMRCLTECDHALNSYLVYAACNVVFNIALLALTAYSSALLTFLSLKMMVPLVALLSPVNWPLIGSHSVSAAQWGVLALMLLAVSFFRFGNIRRERNGNDIVEKSKETI